MNIDRINYFNCFTFEAEMSTKYNEESDFDD